MKPRLLALIVMMFPCLAAPASETFQPAREVVLAGQSAIERPGYRCGNRAMKPYDVSPIDISESTSSTGMHLQFGLLLTVKPPQGYETRKIEGWKVNINTSLIATETTALKTALSILRGQLVEIKRVVPAAAVARLQEVTLWFNPEYPGVHPTAEYHPGQEWLISNGRNPLMVKGVEFTNTRIFDAENKRMPCFVLHELAHSYHDRVLGFEQPDVLAAYKSAVASKAYEAVERHNGEGRPVTTERAYAMTNEREYFAESSEAYFGTNDFFPFNREQLKQSDPQMFGVLERVWYKKNR